LHKLAGKAMVQHVVDGALELAPQQICVVYGHGGEAVPNALANYSAQFVMQEPQLGTGHAVQQAMPLLADDSHTLVLYGDVPLTQLSTLKSMFEVGDGLVLLTVNLAHPTGYGRIVRNANDAVQCIVEEKDATPAQRAICEVNTGILLAPTALLRSWLNNLRNENAQGEYYLTDIVAMAVAQGVPVRICQPAHEWEIHGVNNKSQLAVLERIWQQNTAQALLAKGTTLADPARIDVRGTLSCGKDVFIDVGCVFSGDVQLGDNVQVGAYSIINQATIAAETQVAPYSHIDQSIVGENCRIGPYARLRPGTELHADAHVGNFVELKNTELGKGSKANHLSYLGDSTIGQRVNIGAGTITCNYDGANKFRTVIEDDAFIGSDTQLVAPVTVGKGATIGAGSTITRNTPEAQLTLSRSKQMSIAGWKRPVKIKK
jgi:bifunctional UDP-N-acetylglucosamine pyrophosphorylase/glucosamine-1-phosphate N-acetyltransferase